MPDAFILAFIMRSRFLGIVLLLGTLQLPAQDARDPNVFTADDSAGQQAKHLLTNILLDQKAIWTSPFHTSAQDARWWLFSGITTAALLAADHRVSQNLPFSGPSANAGTDISRIGQWYTVFPAAGLLYGAGYFAHDSKLRETGLLSLQALADSDIVVNVMKVAARRQRPRDGDGGGHFEKGGSSFPSGHSTQAWALASVIAHEYGDRLWVPFAAYGYAAAVSVSRVLAQEHFTSDVFVGGAIGFFVGRYVVHTQRLHEGHGKAIKASLPLPMISTSFSAQAKTLTLVWNH